MTRRRRSRESGSGVPRIRPQTLAWVLGIGLGAFVLGYLATVVFLFGGGGREGVVTVPDLRGHPEAEARRLAAEAELGLEVGASLVNPDVAAGDVLAQSPLPGEEVARGSAIRVTLSSGRDRRPIPDVWALNGQQAQQLLSRAGFEVLVEERTDSEPAGRLLEISPAPGTLVEVPATVRLVVSSGPPRVEVPSVLGMREADARMAIEAAGFYADEVEYDPFSLDPAGTVIAQSPGAGELHPMGSVIRIVLAGSAPWDL